MEEGEAVLSLLTSSFEDFIIMNKTIVPDGFGSVTATYTEGPTIQGAMPYNNSTLAVIARAAASKTTYTLTVRKNIDLDFHTILKRKKDGKLFRLLTGTDDHQTPPTAGLNMRQYDAEEYTPKKGETDGQSTSAT